MKTQLIKTTSELLPARQQQRAEPPAFIDRMSQPEGNSSNHKVVIEIALTIELRVHGPTPSPTPGGMIFGIRMR